MFDIPPESAREIFKLLQPHINSPPPSKEDDDDPEFRKMGKYKHRYWDTVRELKGVQTIASLPGYEALPIICEVLESRGHELRDLGYKTEEEAIDDLEPLWDNVKLAMWEEPLTAASRKANAAPITFKTKRLSQKYQWFLNIAYQLQLMRGEEYIILPVELLAKILGVSPQRVSDLRGYAKADGYLDEVAKAFHKKGTQGVATKFFFRWEGKV